MMMIKAVIDERTALSYDNKRLSSSDSDQIDIEHGWMDGSEDC